MTPLVPDGTSSDTARGGGRLVPVLRALLPTLLIALAWIFIWAAWPRVRTRAHAAILPAPRVSFVRLPGGDSRLYMDPTVFGRSSRVGFAIGSRVDSVPGDLPYRPPSASTLLPAAQPGQPAIVFPATMSAGAASEGSFVPSWPVEPAFHPAGAQTGALHVAAGGDLRKFGLRVPEFPATIAGHTTGTWSVTVYVEMDDGGRASHVFLESGSPDAGLNAAVIRLLSMAALDEPGHRCSGRVEVGFGL